MEAEPLLLQAYGELKERTVKGTVQAPAHIRETLERIVQLYDAWDRGDQADEWRKKLAP